MIDGYKVFLHERDQFWPGGDMVRLGQAKAIYVNIRSLTVGEFSVVQRKILNTPAKPCQERDELSFTRCLMEFVARRVGCHLDWLGTFAFPQYPPCQTLEQLKEYSNVLENIKELPWPKLTKETGCIGKCVYKEYHFNKVNGYTETESSQHEYQLREETITWDLNYSSAFLLTAEKTAVEGQEELLVFETEDLINGIGGALGLFLGWSILYLGTAPIFLF